MKEKHVKICEALEHGWTWMQISRRYNVEFPEISRIEMRYRKHLRNRRKQLREQTNA